MKILYLSSPWADLARALPECDFAVFPFSALGEVDYESELSGKSEKFGEMARLSGINRCAVLCGCSTFSRGLRRKSVAVAENGRLIGITDMLNVLDGEPYKSGANLGVYKLMGYTVGVCAGNDLYFPEIFSAFSACGCNLVLVCGDCVTDNIPPLLIRSYAFLYGAPVVLCSEKRVYLADIDGTLASTNRPLGIFEVTPRNSYRVVTSRRKGLMCSEQPDF